MNTSTMNNLNRDINKVKKSLISRAKLRGIWENFGEREYRRLMDKWAGEIGSMEAGRALYAFEEWCCNYTG